MKPLVCIFAHPDDEAFGPGGTIALQAKERDVYVICVTDGDAGQNSSEETRDLGTVRKEELLRSTNILGVKEVFFLGYKDGYLSNALYHEIAKNILHIISPLQPDTLLTFEPRGVSGHIDHIAVSMITSYVFEKAAFVHKLLYYCITTQSRALQEPYFIYFPPG
jgi:LmbE family N-acetylglucosaminyl deacetylase